MSNCVIKIAIKNEKKSLFKSFIVSWRYRSQSKLDSKKIKNKL